MRDNRNLQGKLGVNQYVGEVLATTNSKSLFNVDAPTHSQDRIYLRRFVGYQEFVFKEIGFDILDQWDF
jgi:hypothetical protein